MAAPLPNLRSTEACSSAAAISVSLLVAAASSERARWIRGHSAAPATMLAPASSATDRPGMTRRRTLDLPPGSLPPKPSSDRSSSDCCSIDMTTLP
jgi:hypothetical protein